MRHNPKVHRVAGLASRAKTRIKVYGKRGLTDASEEEIRAMAEFLDLFLEDYPGPLTPGEPDLALKPTPELENAG